LHGSGHIFCIAAIIGYSRHLEALTSDEIPPAAPLAASAMSSVPSDTDPLAGLPLFHTRPRRFDDSRNFMSWNAGILKARPQILLCENVSMAFPSCLNLNQILPTSGGRHVAVHELQRPFRLPYFHRFHLFHGVFSFGRTPQASVLL